MRYFILFAVLLAMLAALSACAANPAETPDAAAVNDPAGAEGEPQRIELTDEQKAQMEEFQKIIGQDAAIQGVVSKVVGNEVTLLEIEPLPKPEAFTRDVPVGGAAPNGASAAPGGEAAQGVIPAAPGEGMQTRRGELQSMTEEERKALRDKILAEGGGTFSIQGGPGGGNFAMFGGQNAELEVTYTGEEITVTIPSALEIRSGMSTIAPTELGKKQILSLWEDEDGTIVFGMVQGTAAANP